jgi:DNA-binding transcriptional ArsR family regulator
VEEIPELYNLETVEQLRAIADPLRVRIVDALSQRALTATGLGEALGLPANKAHYHVRELEKVGLARLVETREKGGILEKYYRAVARTLDVPGALLRTVPPDESVAVAGDLLHFFTQGFLRALAHGLRLPDWSEHRITFAPAYLWMTDEEYGDALKKVYALLESYRTPRGVDGEREHAVTLFSYDTSLARDEHGPAPEAREDGAPRATPTPTPTPTPTSTPLAQQGLARTIPAITIGVTWYSRADLEAVVARGERLDLNVVGVAAFADDIPADLADRAVARFRHRGALRASPAVRDALARKREEV